MHFEPLEDRKLLAAHPILTVNTTLDEKDGGTLLSPAGPDMLLSLREAITVANLDSGPNTIKFNIPTSDPGFNGQWWTIRITLYDPMALSAALPTLTDSGTTIDGFSQPGNTNPGVVGSGGTVGVDQVPLPQYQKPEIAIDRNGDEGTSAIIDFNPRGLTIGGNASNILITGMAIYDVGRPLGIADDFDIAIFGEGGSGTNRVVESMLVGVLPDGGDPGLERDRGFGVRQDAGGQLTVTKNYVGWNGRGGLDGVSSTSVVTFEYNEVFESGWASGDHDGIDVNGVNSIARYNLSRDNTNSTMVIATGGSGAGIELGSQTAGTGGNLVENNTVYGNLSSGISVRAGASLNTIRKNVIFDNHVGISVNEESRLTHRNQISMNSIYMNFGLGIDLQHKLSGGFPGQWVGSPDGGNDTPLTGQDHADPDTGSNDLQNYPIINSVLVTSGGTDISGVLDSTPLTTFTIEFFATPDGVLFLTNDREGKDFIGSIHVTTDATGIATFNAHFNSQASDDDVITATATKFTGGNTPWSTSEFSPSQPVITLQEKVTGGGWYNQPLTGTPTPTLTDDRANFGFNAQYKKTNPVPQGVTNFHYRPANLHFLSTSYAPLSLFVIEISPGVHRATWRGLGKVNNVSGYGFRADVTDAGEPGTSDTFHIKIWQEVDGDPFTEEPVIVYDNDPTSTGTILGGGNIQVHMSPNGLQTSIAADSDSTSLQTLTDEALNGAVGQAIAWWRGEGVDEAALAILADAQVLVTTLPDSFLGVAANGVIGIDRDAAGLGWSLDASTLRGVDLLSVVTHELGHLLGFEHDDRDESAMAATLQPGVRLFAEHGPLSPDMLATSSLPSAGAVTVALNQPFENDVAYLSVMPVAVAVGDTRATFSVKADAMSAIRWDENVWVDDIAFAAVRDAFDIDVAAWLVANRAISLARPWSADARTLSASPTATVPTEEKLSVTPNAPANADEDSDQENVLSPNEESEPQLADQLPKADTQDASTAGSPLPEDSCTETLSAESEWCRACDTYFAGEHREVDLRKVAAMAAGIAVVVSGHQAMRRGQRTSGGETAFRSQQSLRVRAK